MCSLVLHPTPRGVECTRSQTHTNTHSPLTRQTYDLWDCWWTARQMTSLPFGRLTDISSVKITPGPQMRVEEKITTMIIITASHVRSGAHRPQDRTAGSGSCHSAGVLTKNTCELQPLTPTNHIYNERSHMIAEWPHVLMTRLLQLDQSHVFGIGLWNQKVTDWLIPQQPW